MVKSVLGVNEGFHDWAIQRISAIVMALYSIGLIAYVLCHSDLSYAEWHSLFANTWMKVASAIFLLSIVYHAWIGMWTIYTDYIKPFAIRTTVNFVTLLLLAACFFWGIYVLWSI